MKTYAINLRNDVKTISEIKSDFTALATSVFGVKSGTNDVINQISETFLSSRPDTSLMTYFPDGKSIKTPDPITLREWKALPTSAGKTFEWEGIVTSVSKATFEARLMNVKGMADKFVEYADFDLQDVPDGDRDLVQPGGVFRWVVGLESRSSTRQKYSKIVFRRLPAWTQRSLQAAEKQLRNV
jgi:hypothetical protein